MEQKLKWIAGAIIVLWGCVVAEAVKTDEKEVRRPRYRPPHLVIEPVDNGYIVREIPSDEDVEIARPRRKPSVFETVEGLTRYIRVRYTPPVN